MMNRHGTKTVELLILLWCWALRLGADASSNETCPSSCFCDDVTEYVSCVGEGPLQLPTGLPQSTLRLELRNFFLSVLKASDLEGLVQLRELKIQQASLSGVEGAAFAHLRYLVRLELSQNRIENVTSEVFDGLQNLRYLDLSSNSLVHIEDAFHGLVNVEQLNLRANQLSELGDKCFTGLQKVQYLNLDYNVITFIEVGAFQYLVNLAHLILSNNPLKTLARLDFFGSRLQYIDVSNISLEGVPQSLTRFVRDLRIAKNSLTRISAGDFESYPYLGLLVLDDNLIEEIENDALGRQEYLLRLWLNGNRLTRVPVNLPQSLMALYMEENQLSSLPPYSFRGLRKLETLFLQRNRIVNLSSCAFCDLINLTSLDLQANRIEELYDGVFANLTKLETLDLSQNNLKTLGPRCFIGLEGLRFLQLSRVASQVEFDETIFDPLQSLQTLEMYDSALLTRSIAGLSRVLQGLRRLQELNIMHNKLSNLRSDFPSFFPMLKVIKMNGNNWHCSPNITWLANWIKMTNVQFYRSYSIRCASPQRLFYKPIMLLNEDDFKEPTTDTYDTSITSIPDKTTPVRLGPGPTKAAPTTSTLESKDRTTTSTTITTTNTIGQELLDTVSAGGLQTTTGLPIQTANPTTDPVGEFQYTLVDAPTIPSDSYKKQAEPTTPLPTAVPTTGQTRTSPEAVQRQKAGLTYQESAGSVKNVQKTAPHRNASQMQRTYQLNDAGSKDHHWNQFTAITLSTSLAGGCLILLTMTLLFFTIHRCRRSRFSSRLRRSSSISYHPQRDEVSIVTVSEGTVGWKTSTHHGLGNKLYYALENVDIMNDHGTTPLVANPL